MANTTGVYPVHENQFKIDKTGGDGSTESNLVTIADMESFSVSIDGNIEEWKPFDQKGWTRRLLTGKSITISISGKRTSVTQAMTTSRALHSKQVRRQLPPLCGISQAEQSLLSRVLSA